MDFKKFLNNITWKPQNDYSFTLRNIKGDVKKNNSDDDSKKEIYTNLPENLNYIKNRFNIPLNSDIILREFDIIVKSKHYNAFLVFIDGMVDSNLINNFILKPLMLKNFSNTFVNNVISDMDNQGEFIVLKRKWQLD